MKKRFKYVAIPIALFLFLSFSYLSIFKTIPFSYWDEWSWVGRSYFFQYFIHQDFSNPVWKTIHSYDQPKLGEFLYGAWLYPRYLTEKQKSKEKDFDYIKFLIFNGLYKMEECPSGYYRSYKDKIKLIEFNEEDEGMSEYFVHKYGPQSLKTIDLISYARSINIILFALSGVIVYLLVRKRISLFESLILTFFYGFNTLLIMTSLKAHSEALFLFFFNGSLISMVLFFFKNKKFIYLFIYSIFTGLCISTKLNGAMMMGVFISFSLYDLIFHHKKTFACFVNSLKNLIFSCLVVFIIFICLNPFVMDNPMQNIAKMYSHRMQVAQEQTKLGYRNYHLSSPIVRIVTIFNNFLLSKQNIKFNNIYYFPKNSSSAVLTAFFIFGFIIEVNLARKRKLVSLIILWAFLNILLFMSEYLLLDWDRYYVQLVFFFIYYQCIGFFSLITFFMAKFKNLMRYLFFNNRWLQRARHFLNPRSNYRIQLEKWLGQIDVKTNKVLDIGGGALSVRSRVRTWQVKHYRILDNTLEQGKKPDIYLDLNLLGEKKFRLSVKKTLHYKPNVIFCLEVMEYIYDPISALCFLYKILAKSGIVYISFPSIYPVHEPREYDYLRYTKIGVEKLLRRAGFNKWKIEARIATCGKNDLKLFYKKEKMHYVHTDVIYDIGYMVKAYK